MKKWIKRALLCTAAVLLLAVCGVGYLFHQLTARVPGQYFDSAGTKIYYTDEGKGEPIVLIHGLAANADINWRRAGITDALAKEFRVVAMDLRGHGLSDCSHDPKAYGIEMARDVTRLMDHLKIERAHIAGYSLGGFIALKCVAENPGRFISAAYCASGWKDPAGPEELLSPYKRPEDQKVSFLHDGVAYQLVQAKTSPMLSGPTNWIRDSLGDRLVDRKAIKALKKGFRELIVTREQMAALKTPGICFIGTNDGLRPYAEDLIKVQPAIELVVLDGANHITTAMRRDFRDRLRGFFETHLAGLPMQTENTQTATR